VVSGTEPIRIAWPREVQDQQYSVQVESYRSIILSQVIRYYNIQAVARQEGEGGKLPPYGLTSKNYVICMCFHCHGTSSYHTTNTLQGRRAKSHVDTQTIQPGLGDFVL